MLQSSKHQRTSVTTQHHPISISFNLCSTLIQGSEVLLWWLSVASCLDLSGQKSSKVKLQPLKPLDMWSKATDYHLQPWDDNNMLYLTLCLAGMGTLPRTWTASGPSKVWNCECEQMKAEVKPAWVKFSFYAVCKDSRFFGDLTKTSRLRNFNESEVQSAGPECDTDLHAAWGTSIWVAKRPFLLNLILILGKKQ